MEKYYSCRLRCSSTATVPENESSPDAKTLLSEYDRYRQTLMDEEDDEGWASELQCYLKAHPVDVTKDTDIIQWWQVCSFLLTKVCF